MINSNRLKFLQITVCLGFLAGILFSHELWFPAARTFPRAPLLITLPETFVLFAERGLSVILTASLILLVFERQTKTCLSFALGSLLLLVLLDQNRLQPWVYQYGLILLVMSLHHWQPHNEAKLKTDRTLSLLQILLAGLYLWSGIQKLNYTFAHETLPFLLAPLQNLFPAMQIPLGVLGICLGLLEFLIGGGLFFRRTRNPAVWLAAAMHTTILGLLVIKNYNGIVWLWNLTLIVSVFLAFWKTDISVKDVFDFKQDKNNWSGQAAAVIVAISLLMPVLSFFGWWDLYLSGALYSGSTETAVVRINSEILEKLPATARQAVFQTNGGMIVLPLFEWAMTDLNVPIYPERRVFTRTTREICRLATDKTQTELIIKERPAMLDGHFEVLRINCAQIEN